MAYHSAALEGVWGLGHEKLFLWGSDRLPEEVFRRGMVGGKRGVWAVATALPGIHAGEQPRDWGRGGGLGQMCQLSPILLVGPVQPWVHVLHQGFARWGHLSPQKEEEETSLSKMPWACPAVTGPGAAETIQIQQLLL